MQKTILALLVFVSFSWPAFSQIYKWKDKDGNIIMSTTPPPPGVASEKKELDQDDCRGQRESGNTGFRVQETLQGRQSHHLCDRLVRHLPQSENILEVPWRQPHRVRRREGPGTRERAEPESRRPKRRSCYRCGRHDRVGLWREQSSSHNRRKASILGPPLIPSDPLKLLCAFAGLW